MKPCKNILHASHLGDWLVKSVSLFAFCLSIPVFANPITVENNNQGSRGWNLSYYSLPKTPDADLIASSDLVGEIKGYMSATSVNKGGTIDFHISVNPVQNFTIEIYRAGWYGGNGGRLMTTIGPIAGTTQPACPHDSSTGIVECNWSASYRLRVPANWTSGIYLAHLKTANTNNGLKNFDSGAIFVVRDDNRKAAFIYQQPVNTYQAYNQYPEGVNGQSLYDGNISGLPNANKVSFNRPYAGLFTNSNGYGDYLNEELELVKWIEKQGYDVKYITDVDTHQIGKNVSNPFLNLFLNPLLNPLTSPKALISAGHNEYWSKEMRDAFENARSNRINLAVFGANASYWQVRYEPASDRTANRTLVCYKSSVLDPQPNPALKTDMFRSPAVNRPEQTLLGAQFKSWVSPAGHWDQNLNSDLIVKNTSLWPYLNSGLTEGGGKGIGVIPKLAGYEIDQIDPNYPLPVNTSFSILAQSPFFDAYGNIDANGNPVDFNGNPLLQNSVIYSTPQGGWVFNAGTIAWSWGLDYDADNSNINSGDLTSFGIQQVTKNIMDKFSQ